MSGWERKGWFSWWVAAAAWGCMAPAETSEQRLSVGRRAQTLAASVPPGFREELIASGLSEPVALRFTGDGRAFLAEKNGRIWSYASLSETDNPVLVADLRASVHNYWDRGLLGLAVHPDFPAVPELYALYTHDAFANGTGPRWGSGAPNPSTFDPCPSPPGPTQSGCVVYGRLSRIRLDPETLRGEEQALLSGNWCQQFPSHSTGDLVFGRDGFLYASAGDGASFNTVDFGQLGTPANPCGDPNGEGGALRSQDLLSPGDATSFDGSVLRLDVSGAAVAPAPGNPLLGSGGEADDMIVAVGLRNPYRLQARPGTDEVWIADVGWNDWEELNRLAPSAASVANFGWPCYEGSERQSGYSSRPLCQRLYAGDFPSNLRLETPYFAYDHGALVVPGDGCGSGGSSVAGIAFNTGDSFPEEYSGALFFADSTRRCVWTLLADADGNPDPDRRALFAGKTTGRVVDIQMGPDGNLYYVDFDGGDVYRIAYSAATNTPPSAALAASPLSGALPLSVAFDASASSDREDGSALDFAWDLDDDGVFADASGPRASSTFTRAGSHRVQVRVTDSSLLSQIASITVVAGNTPPLAVIDSPAPGSPWSVGELIEFSGHASDAESGPLPPERLSWSLILHHCATRDACHEHHVTSFEGVAFGDFTAPDHEYPAYLELRLVASDGPAGSATTLSATASVLIEPRTIDLLVETQPSGLSISIGSNAHVTPFAYTAIDGSTVSLSAPLVQESEGVSYGFQSWSDAEEATHDIIASASTPVLRAAYVSGAVN